MFYDKMFETYFIQLICIIRLNDVRKEPYIPKTHKVMTLFQSQAFVWSTIYYAYLFETVSYFGNIDILSLV